jgi:outer membrane receptor for ferrienterochelin and colicin
MAKKFQILLIFYCIPLFSFAQSVSGVISEKSDKESKKPLLGANVFWLGTTKGVATDENGRFQLNREPNISRLVISFIGYKSDTVDVQNADFVEITLKTTAELEAVVIESNKDLENTAQHTELLTTKELRKAACCNLSESFETNASVDVSTTDAVSGTKQIRMLGLDGVYAQIMTENVPLIRGLASRTGLYFVPGTWIKSIDINKGAGSVVNGYESLTGQINIELAKPQNSEKLLLNFYANSGGRLEANLNTTHKISKKWSTAFLLHASNQSFEQDMNHDDFLDNPKLTQLNAINRWKYEGEAMEADFGVKVLHDTKTAGQPDYSHSQDHDFGTPYGANFQTTRVEAFSKTGFFLGEHSSIGIITNLLHHRQNSVWGINDYEGTQNYFLLNAIFQTELAEKHTLKLGMSQVIDNYKERYYENHNADHDPAQGHPVAYFDRKRAEFVPGVFAEFSFNPNPRLAIVPGLRADFHNLFGTFITPRLHFKYNLAPTSIIRLLGGRGFRVANPLVENVSYLISSRKLTLQQGLQPEIAWNYGGSFTQQFKKGEKNKGNLVIDFYRTDFQNQVVTDLDSSPQQINIGNLNGQAFANSFQVSFEYELFKRFDMRFAYKYYQVRTTIQDKLIDMPFIPKDRLFLNLGYATFGDRWQFDFTAEWFGRQRLPNTKSNPAEFQRPERTPTYLLINAQILRVLGNWEVYLGGENLGNYRQQNPIIQANDPYGANFDAGMVYAPIMGRLIYAGMRFYIK